MARPKKEQWVSGKEAARIMGENSGRPIAASYVRLLASKGKIATREIDGRTSEYKLSDVEAYIVKPRDQGKGFGKSEQQQSNLQQGEFEAVA